MFTFDISVPINGYFLPQVRDRATYFKAILEQQQPNLNSQFILNGMQVSAHPD